ncbi:RNA-binding protein NOB1-like isoform X2 [Lineus longissimus]
MLEKEFVGDNHIKTVPERKAVWTETKKTLDKATDVAGFYLGPKKVDQQRSRNTTECSNEGKDLKPSRETDACDAECADKTGTVPISENSKNENIDRENTGVLNDGIEGNKDTDNSLEKRVEVESEDLRSGAEGRTDTDKDLESERSDLDVETRLGDGDVVPDDELLEETDSESEEEDDDDDDDDDDGWITPQNIASVKKTMKNTNEEESKVTVGCLTMDFAMQNVLLQLGLNVISVDGMLIKRTKSYVLRCYACNKIATRMTLQFCPSCGNKTLRKVAMTVGADGSIQYFMSKRRAPTTRGMNQSIPAPQGGKHSQNPILFADQPLPQQKPPKKALGATDVFDPDYDAKTSPFALNDVTSRAAQLGIKQRGRQGQGNKKRHGKRR